MECFICGDVTPKFSEICGRDNCKNFANKIKANIRRNEIKTIGEKAGDYKKVKDSKLVLFDQLVLADRQFLKDAEKEANKSVEYNLLGSLPGTVMKYLPFENNAHSIVNIYNIFQKFAPKTLHSEKYSFLGRYILSYHKIEMTKEPWGYEYYGDINTFLDYKSLAMTLVILKSILNAKKNHDNSLMEIGEPENCMGYNLKNQSISTLFILFNTFDDTYNRENILIYEPNGSFSKKINEYNETYCRKFYEDRRTLLNDFIFEVFINHENFHKLIEMEIGRCASNLLNPSGFGLLHYIVLIFFRHKWFVKGFLVGIFEKFLPRYGGELSTNFLEIRKPASKTKSGPMLEDYFMIQAKNDLSFLTKIEKEEGKNPDKTIDFQYYISLMNLLYYKTTKLYIQTDPDANDLIFFDEHHFENVSEFKVELPSNKNTKRIYKFQDFVQSRPDITFFDYNHDIFPIITKEGSEKITTNDNLHPYIIIKGFLNMVLHRMDVILDDDILLENMEKKIK